ncbi:MAG: hypothetical protein IJ814_01810 [Paludibacteraceae bacterium]|nr:hypothetical protein [Paludibacteraceae bacterium]
MLAVKAGMVYPQDFVRMGERTILGSARYVGMSGAMTAIGGDPSASMDNPAGLGLYRRPEAMVSFDYAWDRTRQNQIATSSVRTNRFAPTQASLVITVGPFDSSEQGMVFSNFMISYRRLHSYYRGWYGIGGNDASLGALLATTGVNLGIDYCADALNQSNDLSLSERGTVNEFSADWAVNIGNCWYVGAGLHVQSYSLSADAVYAEKFNYWNAQGKQFYNENTTWLNYSGAGCNLAVGMICRPVSWIRLGISLQTPTLGSLNIYSRGTLWAQTDTLGSSAAADLVTPVNNFHMPLRVSSSVAFQCGYYGMLALQYDFCHQPKERDVHTLRAGLEVVPVPGLYINAGYAYESTFNKNDAMVSVDPVLDRQDTYYQRLRFTQYASAAIGYRGRYVIVQAAYQYRWQGINLHAHENAQPYTMNTDTHRLVVTFGWHRGW